MSKRTVTFNKGDAVKWAKVGGGYCQGKVEEVLDNEYVVYVTGGSKYEIVNKKDLSKGY